MSQRSFVCKECRKLLRKAVAETGPVTNFYGFRRFRARSAYDQVRAISSLSDSVDSNKSLLKMKWSPQTRRYEVHQDLDTDTSIGSIDSSFESNNRLDAKETKHGGSKLRIRSRTRAPPSQLLYSNRRDALTQKMLKKFHICISRSDLTRAGSILNGMKDLPLSNEDILVCLCFLLSEFSRLEDRSREIELLDDCLTSFLRSFTGRIDSAPSIAVAYILHRSCLIETPATRNDTLASQVAKWTSGSRDMMDKVFDHVDIISEGEKQQIEGVSGRILASFIRSNVRY